MALLRYNLHIIKFTLARTMMQWHLNLILGYFDDSRKKPCASQYPSPDSFRQSLTTFCLCLLLLFSCSVMSDSLLPHGLQHAWLPCPSLSLGVCSNSCPLSRWCHPTISSSVVFFSCPYSFPASGSFPMSQLFALGGQSTGASASVLPMNIQDWFPLRLTGLISFLSKRLSRVFSNATVRKHQFFGTQPSL